MINSTQIHRDKGEVFIISVKSDEGLKWLEIGFLEFRENVARFWNEWCVSV